MQKRSIRSLLVACFAVATSFILPFVAHAMSHRTCEDLFRTTDFFSEDTAFQKKTVVYDGRTVYFEQLVAAPGKPTAILFVGLLTPIRDFTLFKTEFLKKSRGEGLIIYTYSTGAESISAHGKGPENDFSTSSISTSLFVSEATAVINAAGISGAVSVVGYSFGSVPAARFAAFHKDRVANLIFLSPLVVAGEHDSNLMSTKISFEGLARLNPFFGTAIIENARQKTATTWATQFVDSAYPTPGSFLPNLTRGQLIEALVAQIRAVEDVDLRNEDPKLWPPTHFIFGEKENVTRRRFQQQVVESVTASKAGNVDVQTIPGGGHIIHHDKPADVAAKVLKVMRTNGR